MDSSAESKDQKRNEASPTVSRALRDERLVELLYDPDAGTTAFAVWAKGHWSIERDVAVGNDRLIPFSPRNNLIKNEAVLLPSEPREYGNEQDLLSNIRDHIHRYVDLSPSFERIATHYVALTWLYDVFNELPYLRFRGDYGTGKTRALLTIGSLCYKPFFASAASTVSPIFHTLNAFCGTLVFDEADFRFSDERAEIVKVLNNGNMRGMPVLRTMMNRQREFNPEAFQVYGPKIVATRSAYEDKGLESRFITEELGAKQLRKDIPINMPLAFKAEARELRNKLLLYRFRRRAQVSLNEGLIEPDLEPRLNQILLPLLSVIEDPGLRSELQAVAFGLQSQLVTERSLRPEAHVLEVLTELLATNERTTVPVGEVTGRMIERYSSEYNRPITNRWIGGIIRERLGLQTYKSHGVYVVPTADRMRIAALCTRFGIEWAHGL